jgi:hypothetical protein
MSFSFTQRRKADSKGAKKSFAPFVFFSAPLREIEMGI